MLPYTVDMANVTSVRMQRATSLLRGWTHCRQSGLSEFWCIFRKSGQLRVHMLPVCLCWGIYWDHRFEEREILTLRLYPFTTPVWRQDWRSDAINAHMLFQTGSQLWSNLRWNLASEAIQDNNYNNIVMQGFQLIILTIFTRNLVEITQDLRTIPRENGTELNIWKKGPVIRMSTTRLMPRSWAKEDPYGKTRLYWLYAPIFSWRGSRKWYR